MEPTKKHFRNILLYPIICSPRKFKIRQYFLNKPRIVTKPKKKHCVPVWETSHSKTSHVQVAQVRLERSFIYHNQPYIIIWLYDHRLLFSQLNTLPTLPFVYLSSSLCACISDLLTPQLIRLFDLICLFICLLTAFLHLFLFILLPFH